MTQCLFVMDKMIKPNYKNSKGGGSVSSEIVSLIYSVKEEINQKKTNDIL